MSVMPLLSGIRPDTGAPSPSPSFSFKFNPEAGQPLPAGASFARASVAEEYDGTDFTQVSSGTIREDSAAVVGGAQGYLSEPEATNFVSDQDITTWVTTALTPTDDGINSLGLNQFTLSADASSNFHSAQAPVSGGGAAGSGYFIAKEGNHRYFSVSRGDSSAIDYGVFDLRTGVITDEGLGISAALITDRGDGWYKCELNTIDVGASFRANIVNSATPGTGIPVFLGAGEKVLVCHSKYEDTVFSTSPTITSGVQLTRAADVLDTGVVITSEFGALLDITLPIVIGTGNTITLLGPDATAEDILRIDENFNVIMDDGGTPVTIGTVSAGQRIKISYGRSAASRSASLDGATVVTGGAPGAGHVGDTFQIGAANSVNQSRCIHHDSVIYIARPSDSQLEDLSA